MRWGQPRLENKVTRMFVDVGHNEEVEKKRHNPMNTKQIAGRTGQPSLSELGVRKCLRSFYLLQTKFYSLQITPLIGNQAAAGMSVFVTCSGISIKYRFKLFSFSFFFSCSISSASLQVYWVLLTSWAIP